MLNLQYKILQLKRALCSLFVFLMVVFFYANARAQNFTECFNYEIGSVNLYKQAYITSADSVNDELNKKGSNVVWNLNNFEIAYNFSDLVQEIVPSTTVFGYNNFTESNIVKKISNEYNQFLLQDSAGIRLVGIMRGVVEKYIDKKTLINYPHGFSECSVDSFKIDSLQDFFGDYITDIKGITYNCFDAIGEIQFSSGMTVPAYRYTRIDTMRYLIGGATGIQIDMETYWYESNCNLHTPIIFAKGYQGVNGYQNFSNINVLKTYALGFKDELLTNASAFNYKIDSENITITNTSNQAQTISLIDLTGRIIEMQLIKPNQHSIAIATPKLADGIYFLKGSNGDTYKILIAH